MAKNRILITGGGGFIGRHLVKLLLSKGRKVTVLDDLSTGKMIDAEPNIRFIVGDVSDPSSRSEALEDCCALIHLAAIASVPRCEGDPPLSERVNRRAAINLFDEAAKAGVSAIMHMLPLRLFTEYLSFYLFLNLIQSHLSEYMVAISTLPRLPSLVGRMLAFVHCVCSTSMA